MKIKRIDKPGRLGRAQTSGTVPTKPRSFRSPRFERAGEDPVELFGELQAQGVELMVEVCRVVKVELMTSGSMPEDVALDALEVEVDDDQTVIAVTQTATSVFEPEPLVRTVGVVSSICLLRMPWIAI